jgi:AcrR family transcriptional regulator
VSDETPRSGAKSTRKRQQILDAAAKTLSERGYAEATLSDIAQEVGTHAGSLYYYFPSREDLVKEVFITSLKRMSSEFSDALKGEYADRPPLERLLALVRMVIARRTWQRDNYLRAYMRNGDQLPDSVRKELAALRSSMRHNLAALLSEAQAAGQLPDGLDTNLTALFIVGVTNWVGVWYEPTGPKSADEISETFVSLLLNGLLGAQGPAAIDPPGKAHPRGG